MPVLKQSLNAWDTPGFKETLKLEIQQLDPELLPLQAGLRQSSYASLENIEVLILNATKTQNHIHAKAGIFYYGLVVGCNCADDPTPNDETNEYCELLIEIDLRTAETRISLLQETD